MPPVVGLALGAGAARGFAHLGVLQVLRQEGIPIHLISGSSIGSVFGALYAVGHDLQMLEKVAHELKQNFFVDVTVPRLGLLRGKKIEDLLRVLTKGMTFDQLQVPFYAVAVDIEKGERVVLNEGSVAEAVRASIAIPGIFQPKEWQGRLLVDGAVLDRIPIDVAREKGAQVVIAVDVKYGGYEVTNHKVRSIFDIMLQSVDLLERELIKYYIVEADVVIRPNLSHISPAAFDRIGECVEQGRIATLEALPRIKELIGSRLTG